MICHISMATHSDWERLLLTNLTGLFDDGLESCKLTLDDWIQVGLTNFWEGKEVNRTKIVSGSAVSIGRNERSKTLVDVLGQEWSKGRL